jgi:hypothetical protein
VLDRAGRGWRGVDLRPASVRHLQQLRIDLHGRARLEPGGEATTNAISAPVTPAA